MATLLLRKASLGKHGRDFRASPVLSRASRYDASTRSRKTLKATKSNAEECP